MSGIINHIKFNPYKHHLGFLKDRIEIWKRQEWVDVKEELLCIGSNLIDLYYGELAVRDIFAEFSIIFRKEQILNKKQFAQWLFPFDYRKKRLSDNSQWIIKKGTEEDLYIHIHPAKNSLYSVRVRATTLKTVIALKIKLDETEMENINVHSVNMVRTKHLDFSPVKSLEKNRGITRLWEIFNNFEP